MPDHYANALLELALELQPHLGSIVPVYHEGADELEGLRKTGKADLVGVNCTLHRAYVSNPDSMTPRLEIEVTSGSSRWGFGSSSPVQAAQIVKGLLRPTNA